jgi:hypothetical protein
MKDLLIDARATCQAASFFIAKAASNGRAAGDRQDHEHEESSLVRKGGQITVQSAVSSHGEGGTGCRHGCGLYLRSRANLLCA